MSTTRIAHSAVVTGAEEREAVGRVLASGRLAMGPEVEAFEARCAELTGRRYGVAVSSGTAGLHLALVALGAGEGTRVAFPVYACAALRTAVDLAGGVSRFCDVGADYNVAGELDGDMAIVPHLFGAEARLSDSMPVIEDVAQSIGAEYGGGTVAAVASFYATKMITTGEGGMVLTDDEGLAEAVRDLRDYDKREIYAPRFSYKMTEMQAAMGSEQLKRLTGFIARRREIAQEYDAAFGALPLGLPRGEGHVYFRYVVSTDAREALEAHLNGHDIEAKRPVYRPAHFDLAEASEFPGSVDAHERALSIPIHPGLDGEQVSRVIECVTKFFD